MEASTEPTEFQKKISMLSFDEFIVETNIEKIVRRSVGIYKPITRAQLQALVRRYFNLRSNWRSWDQNILRHLKFIKGESKQDTETDIDSTGKQNILYLFKCNEILL